MSAPKWIQQLVARGRTSASLIPVRDEDIIQQLCANGIVAGKYHGRQHTYHVQAHDLLELWISNKYPATVTLPTTAGVRAHNIARTRSSKSGSRTHAAQPILMRWFATTDIHPAVAWTREYGIVSMLNTVLDVHAWPSPWQLLTVENFESFMALAYTPITPVVAVYTGGQLAERTIHALTQLPTPQRALHFGDYDWAGIQIYRGLHKAIPSLAFYVPTTLKQLFQQSGNGSLIEKQKPLTQLTSDHPSALHVIEIISQMNAGLEQEIVPPPELH